MTIPKWLPLVLLLPTAAASADDAFEAGLAAAGEFRYAPALAHFRAAATQGHRQARLIAGGMLLHCGLYGGEFACDRDEGIKWLRLAAAEGSEASRILLRGAAGAGSRPR